MLTAFMALVVHKHERPGSYMSDPGSYMSDRGPGWPTGILHERPGVLHERPGYYMSDPECYMTPAPIIFSLSLYIYILFMFCWNLYFLKLCLFNRFVYVWMFILEVFSLWCLSFRKNKQCLKYGISNTSLIFYQRIFHSVQPFNVCSNRWFRKHHLQQLENTKNLKKHY